MPNPDQGAAVPEPTRGELTLKEVVRFGPLAISYGTWGTHLTPTDIYTQAGLETPSRVAENGFKEGGYHSPLDYDVTTNEAQEELADHAVEIGLAALEARGWQSGTPVRMYFGSTSAQPATTSLVAEKLAAKGVSVLKASGRGFACASGAVSLIDACLDPENQGVPTVIVCAESLSGKIASSPDFRATFSNGASALAFIPGEEVEVLSSQVIVADDDKDSIRLPAMTEYPPHDPSFIPPHYQIGEDARVHASELGIFQEFHHSHGDTAEWDPEAMGYIFKKNLPPSVLAVLQEYIAKYGVDNLQPIVLAHQANQIMVNGIINGTRPKSLNGLLAREQIVGPDGKQFQVYAPWVMDKLGISNVSAATTFIALAELARNGAKMPNEDPEGPPIHVSISPHQDLMVVAYGIGYSVVPAIIRIKSVTS